MDPAKGYGFTSVESFENFDAVLEVSRDLFQRKNLALEKERILSVNWGEHKRAEVRRSGRTSS